MSEDVKALIAEAKTWTTGPHMESQSEMVTSIISRLTDALEAAQPQGEYHEGLEEGIKIGRAEAAQQAPAVKSKPKRVKAIPYRDYHEPDIEPAPDFMATDRATSVAQQAPAVDREALVERVDGSALDHFLRSFNGDEAGDIDYVFADDGNTGWAMRGGNDVASVLLKAFDAFIASGIPLDAAEVEARGLERLIERVTDDGLVQVFGGERFVSVALLVSEARAQQVREGKA